MVSRLDRLFILLDTGSNESIRLAAAKQLGEVQKVQPDDLDYLLKRIQEYSSKSVWETRVAAGHAIRFVLEHVETWPPAGAQSPFSTPIDEDDKFKCRQDLARNQIKSQATSERIFKDFNIDHIIASCPKLLSLDLIDANVDDSSDPILNPSKKARTSRKETTTSRGSHKNNREQLLRQRKLINKELGLSNDFGVKSTDIVSNDDLQPSTDCFAEANATAMTASTSASSASSDARTIVYSFTSNYEKIIDRLYQENCILNEKEATNVKDEQHATKEWPLTEITRSFVKDLFNSSWEMRHGAAIALREIVKSQGRSAGRRSELLTDINDELNQIWLIDLSLKALTVLALDKFGDFLFDQVVAPVRENAAQLLGCCVAYMSEKNAHLVLKVILQMLDNPNWETRHGGILGLKYSLNIVDVAFAKRILEDCFEPIFKCLGDTVDDVSAEVAASLVPVKDLMIEVVPDKTPKLIKFLWEHLADLDELTTSTSNIVLLLASLITSNSSQLEPNELTKSIPRLWSLLSHSSTTVRISVLKALLTLMKPQKSTCLFWMPEDLLSTALKLIFQRSVLENMDDVRLFIEEVWMHLIRIDETDPIKSQSERFDLLKITSQYLNYWLCLILQPTNVPIDRGSPMWLNIKADGSRSDEKPDGEVFIGSSTFSAENQGQQKHQVTKCRLLSTKLIGSLYANITNDFRKLPESQNSENALKYLAEMFTHYIKTKSANQRVISGWALESWACHQSSLINYDYDRLKIILPESLIAQLDSALQETSLCYDELASTFTRLQHETRDFVSILRNFGFNLEFLNNASTTTDKRVFYNLNQIQTLCDFNIDVELAKFTSKKNSNNKEGNHDDVICETLYNKKSNLSRSLKLATTSQKNLSTSVLSSLACAYISWRLPTRSMKLIINPIMDCIEIEEEATIQDNAINYLVILFDSLCQGSDEEENQPATCLPEKTDNQEIIDGILKRLIDILSCRALSMIFESNENQLSDIPSSAKCLDTTDGQRVPKPNGSDTYRIILLDNLQRKLELNKATVSRRQSSINNNIDSRTTSSLKRSHSVATSQDVDNTANSTKSGSNQITGDLTRFDQAINNELADTKLKGASIALNRIASHFSDKLPRKLPQLWNYLTTDLKTQIKAHQTLNFGYDQSSNDIKLIKNLRLLEVIGQSLNNNLRKNLLVLFEDLIMLLHSSNPVIRHHSAQCIGILSKMMLDETIDLINTRIITMLNRSDNIVARCGSIEAIALIIEHLQLNLIPKINMFIIHVLRRMSDQNDQVRLMATHCFGKLLSLMPLNLEKNRDTKEVDSKSLIPSSSNQDDQRFIEQLLNPKKLDHFVVPFKISAELRSYQQDGLNWLAFLNRFNLHGILCDEMGLGKTFMTICMVASDHYNECKKKSNDGDKIISKRPLPSLIVCPSTLTEHWLYEIDKFLPEDMKGSLNSVAYSGLLSERVSMRSRIFNDEQSNDKHNRNSISLVIASYDIVRNDIDFFKEVHWNYCVLDEGHIIKNGKTKLSKAIRLLNAEHRLILSGTPIQNNVTELWSLFDFLMPGFLGSERQFNTKYAKPILQSRELKCSSRESEAGALAMESLHRQVLPFILRRLKEEVLDDLPPKIIQDYYCELSPLQGKLYEDFTRSKLYNDVTKKSINELNDDTNASSRTTNSKSHVFQALQYLKNVCNHPKLVLTQKHSQYEEIKRSLDSDRSNLDDINHSSKLKALKQLLIDCGIGVVNPTGQIDSEQQAANMTTIESIVNQHRALIFCQIRSMVNIIENDLLKKHLPSITYLKLDGSIPVSQRQTIVSRFNNDPSIDILLLTTQIGGLGLNLTGADTVIFVEHDWNPTKDLQAMDRAHRIGQRKVVNVYRLITKGTLEEKIMGLQKFKTMVSNTVINQDNTGLGTMNVDQLFDLFEDSTAATTTGDNAKQQRTGGNAEGNGRSFMDLLPELWDQQQYETEYDLSSFVSSLKNC